MADPSQRQLIIAELFRRVCTISQAEGFATDCGLTAQLGDVSDLGPDDPQQGIALAVGDEEVRWQSAGKALSVTLPLSVRALSVAGDSAWLQVEAIVADIKRAVEVGDSSAVGAPNVLFERGPVVSLDKEPGSQTVGAGVIYRVTFKEQWGQP